MSTLTLISDALAGLTDLQAGQLLRALCLLETEGKDTEFSDPILKAVFAIVKTSKSNDYVELSKPILDENWFFGHLGNQGVTESTSSNTLGGQKVGQEEAPLSSPAPLLFSEEEVNNNITNNNKDKSLKEKIVKKKPSLSMDCVEDERFLPALNEWIVYKKEKRQTYTQRGLKQCYKKLVELSGGDPQVALEDVVHFSMSNNYSGLFLRKGVTAKANVTETTINVNDRYDMEQYDF